MVVKQAKQEKLGSGYNSLIFQLIAVERIENREEEHLEQLEKDIEMENSLR